MKEITTMLKKAGYRVFANVNNQDDPTYIFFGNDEGQLGYCQKERFGGYSVSTCHKPNKITGTGFSLLKDLHNPTIEELKQSFCFAPHWAGKRDCDSVVKYNGVSEYFQRETILKYIEL